MELILYNVFCISLFFWVTGSVKYESSLPLICYLTGVILAEAWVLIMKCAGRDKTTNAGAMMVAVLINIGMAVNYRCTDVSNGLKELLENSYVMDLVLMLIAFAVVYLMVRFTNLYKSRMFNQFIAIVLPVCIFGARLSGRTSGGSYIYFAGFIIFGSVLMGFPFVSAWCMASRENRYWNGKVGNISWNLIVYLFYMFLLYGGCLLCNEMGLLLILGLCGTVLFLIRCKDLKSKIFYISACAGGALAAGMGVTHVWNRVQIWLSPHKAFTNVNLMEQAESVLYLFRHIKMMGYWGRGWGSLPKSIYPTLESDHALITVLNDCGVLFLAVVLVLSVLLVRWMLVSPKMADTYDRYLNLCCALIVGLNILINSAMCLGSFPTAGLGFPWISSGGSVGIMLIVQLAVHCGLLAKGGNEN